MTDLDDLIEFVESRQQASLDRGPYAAILARLLSLRDAEKALPEPVAEVIKFDYGKGTYEQRKITLCWGKDGPTWPPVGTKLYPESALLSEVAKRKAAEKAMHEINDDRIRLALELAELRPDARRYRWLRAQHEGHAELELDADGLPMHTEPNALAFTVFMPDPSGDESLIAVGCIPGELNATIDKAMSAELLRGIGEGINHAK